MKIYMFMKEMLFKKLKETGKICEKRFFSVLIISQITLNK